jgi:hypothetical protein
LSANNGSQAEVVTIGSASCTGTDFQIEVRAIVNSRFTISVVGAVGPITAADDISIAAAGDTPSVVGPPALQTAIGSEEIFLPVILK